MKEKIDFLMLETWISLSFLLQQEDVLQHSLIPFTNNEEMPRARQSKGPGPVSYTHLRAHET